jgi:lysyl-tRNA synthetase class 2
MVRLERHPSGPRVYVLGLRIHECHLGLAVAAAAVAAAAVDRGTAALLLAAAAAWLVTKDWRDFFPRLRDTASWRLGLHRVPAPLRERRRLDRLPALAAALALGTGAVNLVSALTPNVGWRGRLLLQVEPVESLPIFHTLAVPASAALIVCAFYLGRRRRRAWQGAFALLVALGALNLLKGLDFEEALVSWGGAGLLWWGRGAFCVRHGPPDVRLWLRALAGALGTVFAVALIVAATAHVDAPRRVGRETAALLLWSHGPIAFGDDVAWLPLAVGALALMGLLATASLAFRPASPRAESSRPERQLAAQLVRAHGRDTLAFFKLRRDTQYFFSSDRRAFLGYRIEGNVMLISGDPVGEAASIRPLLREACVFAERHGLRLGAVGVGASMLGPYRDAGLRALYIGDEAVVQTNRFSLEGRAIRKVRQSVTRLEAAGYTVATHRLGALDPRTRRQLDRVSTHWLGGAPERGFSMAMDSLDADHQPDSLVVLALDAAGTVRAFLHFVPSYGRAAMSLSFMRRERDTPNGLTEFLVVRAIELLRDRGIDELSLNFAAFARFLHAPRGAAERTLGRALVAADRYFQIERLYRFNAKFTPRWEPRYLVFEGVLGLPRVGMAALLAEGQIPRPRLTLARA